MNKTYIVTSAVLLTLLVAGCTSSDIPTMASGGDSGRAVFTMTDAAADMGAVSSVKVTVDSVQVHHENEGWVTASSDTQTYDLLELKASNTQKLLADAQLPNGTYNQLRLDVSNVVVVDENGTHNAKLPSNTLKMQGEFTVEAENSAESNGSAETSGSSGSDSSAEADGAAVATFDFIADESLHVTGDGKYVMAPVVQVTARNDAQVDIGSNAAVDISGGNIATNVKVGMNENGEVTVGGGIPANAQLGLSASGGISLGGSSDSGGGSSNSNTSASASAEFSLN